MHCATNMPTTESGMSAAEAGVSTTKSAVAAATAVTSSAMLRPHRHSEEKRERRDGHQATHTRVIISPFFRNGGSFTICDKKRWKARLLAEPQRLPLVFFAADFLAGFAACFAGLAAGFAFSGDFALASGLCATT